MIIKARRTRRDAIERGVAIDFDYSTIVRPVDDVEAGTKHLALDRGWF